METTQESTEIMLNMLREYSTQADQLWAIIDSQKKTIAGYESMVERYEALVKALQGVQ